MQTLNQLFLALNALILASLFLSTAGIYALRAESQTKIFWLVSVALKTAAFLVWALVPLLNPAFASLASFLFIASAACLGLLFRSWRSAITPRLIVSIGAAVLIVGITCELLRQIGQNFHLRAILIGSASILISAWELAELAKKIRVENNTALKSVFVVILLQILFSGLTVIFANLNPTASISHVAENHSASNIGFWVAITLHVIIYIFIGSYLYQKLVINELKISKEKNVIENLLTERESMIASLVMANRAASVGALSAALAHELSQPLSASTLNSRVLLRRLEGPVDNAELRKIADTIARENLRASNILLTLKDIFTNNHTQLNKENLAQVIDRLGPVLKPHTDKKNIQLDIITKQRNSYCMLNFSEFQQVMVNIVNNAIDALENIQSDNKNITIELDQCDASAIIRIADNGPGIPTEYRDHVFELFKSQKPAGMGFGLWLCRHIIEQRLRGSIGLENHANTGACFVLRLPRA
jgi:signal transduction histidine kinase